MNPEKRAVLSIVLDDGSETIRSSLFGNTIEMLGFSKEQIFSLEEFNKNKNNLLGEEKMFHGQIKTNAVFNSIEFSVNQIENIIPEVLIKEFEENFSKLLKIL